MIMSQDGNMTYFFQVNRKPQTNLRADATAHNLTITPIDGEWDAIFVASDNGYYEMVQSYQFDYFSSIVEEGYARENRQRVKTVYWF